MNYVALVLTGVLILSAPSLAFAGAPTEEVKETIQSLQGVLKNPAFKNNKKARNDKIREIILGRMDFEEMAKRSLGSHWRKYPDRQKEFVELFSVYLESVYRKMVFGTIENMENYGFDVNYLKERLDSEYAEVEIEFRVVNNFAHVELKLHRKGGLWKAYDVLVEHVSLVRNWREQFNTILANKSIDDLMQIMREKTK